MISWLARARKDSGSGARAGIFVIGPVALIGGTAGLWLGLQAAFLIFEPATQPEAGVLERLADDFLSFVIIAIPSVVLFTLLGWFVAPAIVGYALGWKRVGPTVGYQALLGALAIPTSVWLTSSIDETIVTLGAFTLVGGGIPVVARLLATTGHHVQS